MSLRSRIVGTPNKSITIPVDQVIAHTCVMIGVNLGCNVAYIGSGTYNWKAKFFNGSLSQYEQAVNFLFGQFRIGNITEPLDKSQEEGVAISIYYTLTGDSKPYEQ